METQDKDVQAWLSECRAKRTREAYEYRSNLFFKWVTHDKNLSLKQFKQLSPKEMKTLLLQFQNSEPKSEGRVYHSKHKHRKLGTNSIVISPKPLSKNAINGVLTTIQSFCMYLEKPLMLKGKRAGAEDDTHSHYFSNGDLGKMYDVCDLKGKAIIACASSLGWEVTDFLALPRKLVEDHIRRADSEGRNYIFFETTRSKTSVPRLAVLNPLAVKSLKDWLPVNLTDKTFDMTKSGITQFMKATARKANLVTTGTVRFHRIRAWVFNSLLKAGFGDMEAKYIVGKAISHSDGTYLRLKETIMEKYPKFYESYLNIKPETVLKVIDKDMVAKIAALEKENAELREKAKAKDADLEERMARMEKLLQALKKEAA
jgi:hypothetical protein